MLFSFECPYCQALLKVESAFIGKTGGCPNCKKEIKIPEQNAQIKCEQKETVKKG